METGRVDSSFKGALLKIDLRNRVALENSRIRQILSRFVLFTMRYSVAYSQLYGMKQSKWKMI